VAEDARSYLASRETMLLLDMWLFAGGAQRPPAHFALQPKAMAPILADIWLMDYLPAEGRLRYRLEGENIRARYDFSLVGKYLDETLLPEARDKVLGYFLACVQKPAICLLAGRLYHERQQPGYGERLLLPLVNDDRTPKGLVGITICKQTFESRPVAEELAKRITWILPLDGSEPIEMVG
jgi:hypothetical protein